MNNYEINKGTLAIIPVGENLSTVIEEDNIINITKPSQEIIEESCKFFGSSYEGRLEGTKKILGFNYKIPIIIEESNDIIFFPTSSPRNSDCHWISLNKIQNIKKNKKTTKIIFKTGQEISLNISYYSLENQIFRATRLQSIIRDRKYA